MNSGKPVAKIHTLQAVAGWRDDSVSWSVFYSRYGREVHVSIQRSSLAVQKPRDHVSTLYSHQLTPCFVICLPTYGIYSAGLKRLYPHNASWCRISVDSALAGHLGTGLKPDSLLVRVKHIPRIPRPRQRGLYSPAFGLPSDLTCNPRFWLTRTISRTRSLNSSILHTNGRQLHTRFTIRGVGSSSSSIPTADG